jgi:hypothetical protein
MNGFHAGMIWTTEFVGGEELFAEVQIVGTEREEFAAERLVEHERDVPRGTRRDKEVRFKRSGTTFRLAREAGAVRLRRTRVL